MLFGQPKAMHAWACACVCTRAVCGVLMWVVDIRPLESAGEVTVAFFLGTKHPAWKKQAWNCAHLVVMQVKEARCTICSNLVAPDADTGSSQYMASWDPRASYMLVASESTVCRQTLFACQSVVVIVCQGAKGSRLTHQSDHAAGMPWAGMLTIIAG